MTIKIVTIDVVTLYVVTILIVIGGRLFARLSERTEHDLNIVKTRTRMASNESLTINGLPITWAPRKEHADSFLDVDFGRKKRRSVIRKLHYCDDVDPSDHDVTKRQKGKCNQ